MKWGCWGHWGHWGRWGCRGHRGHRYSKAWKITTEYSRVIQVVEFSFILMFWKPFFSGIMKYHFLIFAPFLLEAVEASLSYLFWKLVLITKMSTCQHFKTTFKYNLTCIFLSLRAKLKKTLCPRTPCISANSFRGNYSFLNLTLCTVTFDHSTYMCGNYSRAETICGNTVCQIFHWRI